MSDHIPGPVYRLQTPRLVIRCWQPQDATLLQTAVEQSIDHLRPWMPWVHTEPEALQEKINRLRRFRGLFDLGQDFIYGIFNPDETLVLGGTGLHPRAGEGAREIGYWIHQGHLNQGLATEASAALTKVAFEVEQLRRVEIHCDPDNVRSATVPRKLGFAHEATLRQRTPFLDEHPRDRMIWSLLATDYGGSPAALADVKALDVIGRRLL